MVEHVTAHHLTRQACLYVRQSTLQQVLENTESTARQYALRERARALGWPDERIVVIDQDLGHSGASIADRYGFQHLVAEVGLGHVGLVLGLEVSRLARNSSDWHHLLEICALTHTLILDEEGLYDPSTFNDRLLLGLKGTMSEAELFVLRARLQGGILNKARRGALKLPLPIGLCYTDGGGIVLDPDVQVQAAIREVIRLFQCTGSACATVRHFHQEHLLFPRRARSGPYQGEILWGEIQHHDVLRVLHQPAYAGVYTFGRTRASRTADGKIHIQDVPRSEWIAFVPDAHVGYITWEDYERNEAQLAVNSQAYAPQRFSPPRERPALLQGLLICGRCGERMTVRYHQRRGQRIVPDYLCAHKSIEHGNAPCQLLFPNTCHCPSDPIDPPPSENHVRPLFDERHTCLPERKWRKKMGSPSVSLSYGARREVLTQIAPRYQQATGAQKMLLLDRVVEVTGYARKYAIHLLNHVPQSVPQILRPRLPIYGSTVQEALFLAWRTIQYPCAQRLVPFLPSLIPVLERDGHLQLGEEHRRQLLVMSVRTAERLLSTKRRPAPHGFSTTKPGTLLKHQIPIRTCVQWDDYRPGFLEADLVAHCGGNVFGGYLYTLTLTDIATGWTECLPLLNRSPETVLAAIKYARTLLPFPMLGLDTDNGGEFINETLLAYCQQEQLTFTRGRPECSNDNCHIEQKNGAVVRKAVGHDRLVSALAYQQLGELYQALRLLVNCFQPSMKLQSKHLEGEHERRVYDEAKTPLQRVLLSGVLSDEIQQEWRETAESLDPLRLVQHVEALQRAVWRCAEHGPGTTLVRFSLDACVSASVCPPQGESSDALAQIAPDPASVRDWSRSMDDPFLGEWEQIQTYVYTYPMASAGEILREWQRRFPGRFEDAHLNILQRRLREILASLLASQAASSVGERGGATASRASSELTKAREDVSPLADVPAVVFPDPTSLPSSLPSTPEEEPLPVPGPLTSASNGPSRRGDDGTSTLRLSRRFLQLATRMRFLQRP